MQDRTQVSSTHKRSLARAISTCSIDRRKLMIKFSCRKVTATLIFGCSQCWAQTPRSQMTLRMRHSFSSFLHAFLAAIEHATLPTQRRRAGATGAAATAATRRGTARVEARRGAAPACWRLRRGTQQSRQRQRRHRRRCRRARGRRTGRGDCGRRWAHSHSSRFFHSGSLASQVCQLLLELSTVEHQPSHSHRQQRREDPEQNVERVAGPRGQTETRSRLRCRQNCRRLQRRKRGALACASISILSRRL